MDHCSRLPNIAIAASHKISKLFCPPFIPGSTRKSHTISYLTETRVRLNLIRNTISVAISPSKPSSPAAFENDTPTPTLFQHRSCTTTPQDTMTIDMDWSPAFCLACDRQTDGNVYCSEACRLAEYDASSSAGSTASSPTSPRGPMSWPAKQSSNGFFMEPAYNFSRAKPYGTTPSPRPTHLYQSASRPQSSPVAYSTKPVLTPSSSQSSLFSMQSTHSASSDQNQVSDESRRALRAYASSFDQSRYSRRQSTH